MALEGAWQSWRRFVREVSSNFKPALKAKIKRLSDSSPDYFEDRKLSDPYLKTTRAVPKKSLLRGRRVIPMVDLTGKKETKRASKNERKIDSLR